MSTGKKFLAEIQKAHGLGNELPDIIRELCLSRIVIIATEWGVAKGGVSTLNWNLSRGLGELGHSVLVLVLVESPYETLPPKFTAFDNVDVLHMCKDRDRGERQTVEAFNPQFVLGHDRFTGFFAAYIVKDWNINAKSVAFIHTDPLIELRKHKPGPARQKRRRDRQHVREALLQEVQIAVPVGPRLAKHTRDSVGRMIPGSKPEITEFLPGFSPRDEEALWRPSKVSELKPIIFGRMEDYELKGSDIALEATKRLTDKLVQVGGALEDVHDAWNASGKLGFVDPFMYTEDRKELESFLRGSHVVIMPSREEGFGLVALEAIEANRPVICSMQSGFAEWVLTTILIDEVEREKFSRYFLLDLSDEPGNVQRLSTLLRRISEDYDIVMEIVGNLRERFQGYSWMRTANDLIRSI